MHLLETSQGLFDFYWGTLNFHSYALIPFGFFWGPQELFVSHTLYVSLGLHGRSLVYILSCLLRRLGHFDFLGETSRAL